jgi:hypothetical protein
MVICCSRFKYLFFLTALLGQFLGLILFTIWAADCFFREFRTTPNCQDFSLFPMPKLLEFFWLLSSILVSLFLIYHVVFRSPEFCGTRRIIRHLIKKKYFHKIIFVLLAVVSYDIYVMSSNPQTWKTLSYVSFIMEKSLTVLLMFLLNFLSRYSTCWCLILV